MNVAMNGLSSSEFYARPDKDKLLQDHLRETGNLCHRIMSEKKINFPDIDNDTLENISFIIGISHDFGKSTRFFQEYLRSEEKIKTLQSSHGTISGIFSYFLIKEYLKKNEKLWYLPIIGYLTVKRHHGNLKNPSIELADLDDDVKNIILEQINSIDKYKIKDIYDHLLSRSDAAIMSVDISNFFENIEAIIKEIRKSRRKIIDYLNNENSVSSYLLLQIIFSILINSDKMEASELIQKNRKEIHPDIVDKYRILKYKNKTGKMDTIRNNIYNEVVSNIQNLDIEKRIYSINAPTGTAKTITSISSAIKLRDRIKNSFGITPRIIYCLPFLSIIDQNFDVFEDIFETVENKKPNTDILLKHHHLIDINYSTEEDEFKEDEALFMIEGWNSEIIVTTFVQFFHTIISRRNRSLRKFHNIANSIIILDEIQSIPHEYWLLFREMIIAISNHFNTYFIFITATMPLIFDDEKEEIIELVKNKKFYFGQFDRIELQYFKNPIHIEEFEEIIRLDIEKNKNKNFLIVLNTIRSAKKVFKYITSQKDDNTEYYYISSHIIPKKRLEIIESIKKSKNRKVIISTQSIEAGVDIDEELVYRDVGPFDSIIQIIGRCNRNYNEIKGKAKIFILKSDNREYYKYIYSNFLIGKTKEVLEALPTNKIIYEKQFLELNNSYFRKVNDTHSNDRAKELLGYIKNLRFELIQKEFHLIKSQYEKVDIFIEIDENTKEIWEKFQYIKKINNSFERKKEFLNIRKKFYEHLISVPKDKSPTIDPYTGIAYIPQRDLESYYDIETGFKFKDEGSIV